MRLRLKYAEDAPSGKRVFITGGMLAGRSGEVVAPEDATRPAWLLIELDGDGGNVWIHVDHLSIDVVPNAEFYLGASHVLTYLFACAEYDLRKARGARDNEILICQTWRGLVALAYDRATGVYSLTTQDGGSWRVEGRRKTIKPELVNLYRVIENDEQAKAA